VPPSLRNLIREVKAIIVILKALPRDKPLGDALVERIQELVSSWTGTVRPILAAFLLPAEVLARADGLIFKAVRSASTVGSPSKCLARLLAVRRVLLEQILFEVARTPLAVSAAAAVAGPEALFPEISDLPNQLVPYSVQGWSERIKGFLRNNGFGKNVFIMVAYRTRLDPLIGSIKTELKSLGLKPVLAKDHTLTDDLYNPIACLLCCRYGVAIFDRAETGQMHNPNVVYELAMMQLLKRPCLILKHSKLKSMPSDLLNKIYEKYSSKNEAVHKLGEWWTRINEQ
jgi:hypothetical protein